MNVLMISPGFPDEMPRFTRALAAAGARVIGLGDQAEGALLPEVREALTAYVRVPSLWDEDHVMEVVRAKLAGHSLDRIESLWEPAMELAGRMREEFGVPGLGRAQSHAFRDKERMKQVLDAAGVRTPRHASARTAAQVREAAEHIGFPLILKPVAGAGSADTYPVRDGEELDAALARLGHIDEVSVEEFIEGEEYTFDTICANGNILFENVALYRPKPLVARLNPWISGQAVCLKDIDEEVPSKGRELGRKVLTALGFETGFTHMEWFHTPSGEAVFGEIGARSPGGRLVHVMNYSADVDLFMGWAEAVCHGRISQDTGKQYNAAVVFKRAEGEGRIQAYQGLDHLMMELGEHVAALELNSIGNPKRDWRQVVSGDGWVVVRHPDLETTLRMADRFASELRIVAG